MRDAGGNGHAWTTPVHRLMAGVKPDDAGVEEEEEPLEPAGFFFLVGEDDGGRVLLLGEEPSVSPEEEGGGTPLRCACAMRAEAAWSLADS